MKLTLAEAYSELSINTIRRIYETQGTAIEKAAEKIADSLLNGGILHIFGSGHSHMISREIFGRAGQLIPVSAIVDGSAGKAERCEGYAEMLLRYYDWRPGEVVIVVSNSGRNPLPIEVALKAKSEWQRVLCNLEVSIKTKGNER